MSPTHRPLSPWIAQVRPDGSLGRVNDGDHRADGRWMSIFAEGWRRTGIRLGSDRLGLGLTAVDGLAVVELDDVGRPIQISQDGLAVIDRVEREWPVLGEGLVSEIGLLTTEALPVRYWLTERLAAEGDPPAEAFAILPWDLLERLCGTVVAGLAGQQPGSVPGEIGYWLTSVVPGLTHPLYRLDAALRAGDSPATRQAAVDVQSALGALNWGRLPWRARRAVQLVSAGLARADRDTAQEPARSGLSARLRSTFEPAASSGFRERIEILGDDRLQLRLTQSTTGQILARVRIAAPIPRGELDLVFPVQVTARGESIARRFWVALEFDGARLTGLIRFKLPDGASEISSDGQAVFAAELTDIAPTVLLTSMRASNRATASRWLEIARTLPEHHPVRLAADMFRESLDQ
jgi:hypothetical protein